MAGSRSCAAQPGPRSRSTTPSAAPSASASGRRLLGDRSWLACRLPEGAARSRSPSSRVGARLPASPGARPRRGGTSRRVVDGTWPTPAWPTIGRARRPTDPRALERLVRAAFRHHARYYLEILRAPGLDAPIFDRRLVVENPDDVDAAFAGDGPTIFISGHLGPIELPGLYLAQRSGRADRRAPMETVGDPALQRWFDRTRSAFGVRIVGLREARRELLGGARKRASTSGSSPTATSPAAAMEVPFFGAPAPLPVGPAFLAIETGVPLYLAGIWRSGRRGYRGRARRGPGRPPRARAASGSTQTLEAEAAAFERLIANAPDQWGRSSFADLAGPRGGGGRRPAATDADGRAPAGDLAPRDPEAAHDREARSGRPPHPHARLRRHVRDRRDPRPRRARDRPRRHRDHRPRARRRGARCPGDRPRPRPPRRRSSSARRSRRSAGICSRCSSRSGCGRSARCGPTIAEIHEQGGLAIPAHPLVPYPLCAQGWVLRRLIDDPDPRVRPDAIEAFNPTTLGRPWHSRVVGSPAEHGLATVGNSDAHDGRPRSASAGRRSRGGPPTTSGRRSSRAGRTTTAVPRHGLAGPDVRPPAAQVQPRRSATRPSARSGATARRATSATRRPSPAAAVRRGLAGERSGPRGERTMKIGLVSPYVYPLPGGVTQHVGYLYENLRLRGHDVRILTSSHGLQRASEGDIIRIGKGFSLPVNGSVGTITLSPRLRLAGPGHARARAVRPPPLPRAVRAVPLADPPAALDEREHRDLPRLRRLLAVVRVRQQGDGAARPPGSTAGSP